LLIIELAMESSPDYSKAYETAKRELAELISTRERVEKRILALRKLIETYSAICESEGVAVEPSFEADYMRMKTTLADEIRLILKCHYPAWMTPLGMRRDLEAVGHNLSKYSNPQATIHMVLKRMAESSQDGVEETIEDGKKAYRCPSLAHTIAENLLKFQPEDAQGALSSSVAAAFVKAKGKK
jgi:hypothetical protein